ncbi:MAG TPA: M23 family metallopeptidase [Vicinamibacterales bacterium]|nr:M23 family metallopeptidase [Vicinamibacterales bacterium]
MLRWLVRLLLLLLAAAGATYWVAGRGAPPVIAIQQPVRFIGQAGTLDLTVEAPDGRLTSLVVALEQNGLTLPLFNLSGTLTGAESGTVTQTGPNTIRVTRALGKQSVPELQQGSARLVVSASRPSLLDLRTLSSSAAKDLEVRLDPPRLAVLSTHHFVNHGGSEMVVYRATPSDVTSGVRVGEIEYPGFPLDGAGAAGTGGDLRVAFFALLTEQDLNTPIAVFARDEAGNQATARFVDNVFPKPIRRSRIEIDDAFINRTVPDIIANSPELKMAGPSTDLLGDFLRVNGELRRANAAQIAGFAKQTSPTKLWTAPFVQLGNSKVEAGFADHRTYLYDGREVDQQVHLGFDLAVTKNVPVVAANDGVVLSASWLGIYGNCVIIDHGLGVQSLYGHLQGFEVKTGDRVTRGQTIGRSDSTGLAGGDHLHFTMLVNGQMVNPVEWWDPHWIQDRIDRKLSESGTPGQ